MLQNRNMHGPKRLIAGHTLGPRENQMYPKSSATLPESPSTLLPWHLNSSPDSSPTSHLSNSFQVHPSTPSSPMG
ncbi:hypothetical protein RSAG8_08258, partial [Rhizoctonia solani AG-8 WAC10335]